MRQPVLAIAIGLAALTAWPARGAVIESWDSGSWGANWSSTAAGTVAADAAHDGSYGVSLSGGSWTYNTAITVRPGDTISLWIMPTATLGRIYLGFGADSSGADAFVGASNTGEIEFQDNSGYNFNDLSVGSQSWVSNKWYLMEVKWLTASTAQGLLYDSDGTTLLNSITQQGLAPPGSGIALRGVGTWYADTVSVSATAVPEPSSVALLAAGVAGLGLGYLGCRKASSAATRARGISFRSGR